MNWGEKTHHKARNLACRIYEPEVAARVDKTPIISAAMPDGSWQTWKRGMIDLNTHHLETACKLTSRTIFIYASSHVRHCASR